MLEGELVERPGAVASALAARHPQATRFLHYYQRYFWTSGQVLSGCIIVVLAALGWRRRPALRLRLEAVLIAASAVTALLLGAGLSVFDYRYSLIAVVLLPPAAALAGRALLRSEAERPAMSPA